MPLKPLAWTVPWDVRASTPGLHHRRWIRRAALPLLYMMLVAVCVGALGSWWVADENQRLMMQDSERLIERVQQRFNDYAQIDVGLRSFWVVHQPLQHDDFAMYVAGMDLINRYPGLQTVTIAEQVPYHDEAAFIDRQKTIWNAYSHEQWTFDLHRADVISPTLARFMDNGPDLGREVVTYVEPWQNFPNTIGRIITDDPSMVAALKMGRDQNIAITGNVLRGQGPKGEHFAALSIRLPLYKGTSDTIEERRAHYVGSIGVGLRLDQFFNRIISDNDLEYLDMQAFTTPTVGGTASTLKRWVVYDSRKMPENVSFSLISGRWTRQTTLNIGGYRLWVRFANRRSPLNAWSPLWALIAGLMTFGGLFTLWVLVDSAAYARYRAVTLAALATQDLEKQQTLLSQASQMAGVGHWQLNASNTQLLMSPKTEEILGFSASTLSAQEWTNRLAVEDKIPWRLWLDGLISSTDHHDERLEIRYRRGDEILWLSIIGRRVDSNGVHGPVMLQGSIIDLSQRQKDDMELRLKHRLGTIVTSASDEGSAMIGSSSHDDQGDLFDQQRWFEHFIQRLCDELDLPAGRVWLRNPASTAFECVGTWIEPSLPSLFVEKTAQDNAGNKTSPLWWNDKPWDRPGNPPFQLTSEHREACPLPVRLDWPLRSSGDPLGWIEVYGRYTREALAYDLNEPAIQRAIWQEALQLVRYRAHYARLNYLAGTDPLTGLMSRYRFTENLKEKLLDISTGYAVLFIDLDGFKKVNDSLGHAAGDRVLQDMAARFRGCLGPLDSIGRVGGDEFAILTPLPWHHGTTPSIDRSGAIDLARRLLAVSEQPFRFEHQSSFLGASIGIVVAPDDGTVAVDLIKRADIAMYAVKKQNKNGFQIYNLDLERLLLARNDIERALKAASLPNEMSMVYQPKFRLDDHQQFQVAGLESLLRWNSTTLGPLSPDSFITIAEESGGIHPLGQWVMRTVIDQMTAWETTTGLKMSAAVNISPKQFMDDESLSTCLEWVRRSTIDPHRITLEITEGCLMVSPVRSQKLLNELHEQGFRIAIDDFGMGYSSLAYLKNFPVDELKIDKTFIQNMDQSPKDVAIVDAILNMARSLGMDVVAEGVETMAQLHRLQSMGCYLFQGFLFSPPLPPDDLMRLVQTSPQDGKVSDPKA